jgi:hypothetical protein
MTGPSLTRAPRWSTSTVTFVAAAIAGLALLFALLFRAVGEVVPALIGTAVLTLPAVSLLTGDRRARR